jgi:hypothetical protein
VTLPRRRGRPATGTNPVRSMRIGAIFDEARRIAESHGESITVLVERLLTEYVAKHKQQPPDAPR